MAYVKHFADEPRGQTVQELFDVAGHAGPWALSHLRLLCMEQLMQRLKGNRQMELTDSSCRFVFHTRIVRQELRLTLVKLKRILQVCATHTELQWEISGNSLTIFMPKLLELMDRDSKKARKQRGPSAPPPRLEEEERSQSKDLEEESSSASGLSDRPEPASTPTGVMAELSGNSILHQALRSVPLASQQSWLEEYEPSWLRTSLLKCVNHQLNKLQRARVTDVTGWGLIFTNWLGVETAAVRRKPPASVHVLPPVDPGPCTVPNNPEAVATLQKLGLPHAVVAALEKRSGRVG